MNWKELLLHIYSWIMTNLLLIVFALIGLGITVLFFAGIYNFLLGPDIFTKGMGGGVCVFLVVLVLIRDIKIIKFDVTKGIFEIQRGERN